MKCNFEGCENEQNISLRFVAKTNEFEIDSNHCYCTIHHTLQKTKLEKLGAEIQDLSKITLEDIAKSFNATYGFSIENFNYGEVKVYSDVPLFQRASFETAVKEQWEITTFEYMNYELLP